jgi:hypothetical protein
LKGLDAALTELKEDKKFWQGQVDKENNPGLPRNSFEVLPPRETISLEIDAPKATKTLQLVNLHLKSGRINVKALLKEFRLKRLFFLESKSLLLYDDDGWSFDDTFIHENVYKMLQEPDEGYDISICYSDAKLEKVVKHFNLCFGRSWLPDERYPQISIPDSLFEQLQLLHKRNSLDSENARRALISLFIVNAIECADEDEKLFVHEEMAFSCVREENGTRYKYNGPIDFAIWRSPVDSKLKKTALFCLLKLKRLPN